MSQGAFAELGGGLREGVSVDKRAEVIECRARRARRETLSLEGRVRPVQRLGPHVSGCREGLRRTPSTPLGSALANGSVSYMSVSGAG